MQITMNLYDLTKKYGEGKGESAMWSTLSIVSDALESSMDESEKKSLVRKVYGVISGKHYNEEFAREDIAKMYYRDENGVKHAGPFWPEETLRSIYESRKREIPDYNYWDFAVTMSMMLSDYYAILVDWFPDDDQDMRNSRLIQLALNWLHDEDSPYGSSKPWCYLNPR